MILNKSVEFFGGLFYPIFLCAFDSALEFFVYFCSAIFKP